jgi:serine/threonine protein kinase, bacterial
MRPSEPHARGLPRELSKPRGRPRPKGPAGRRAGRQPEERAGRRAGRQPEEPAGRRASHPAHKPAGPAGAKPRGPGRATEPQRPVRRSAGLAPALLPAGALGPSAGVGRGGRERVQPREAPLSAGRGRDPPRAGSGEGPPVPDGVPGTGLRRVRLARETAVGPPSALRPAGPGPPPAPGRIRPRSALPACPTAVPG